MQTLTILTGLRDELTQAEHALCQAWQRYHAELSAQALVTAVETTQYTAALHRQLADRLEQAVSLRVSTDNVSTSLPYHRPRVA